MGSVPLVDEAGGMSCIPGVRTPTYPVVPTTIIDELAVDSMYQHYLWPPPMVISFVLVGASSSLWLLSRVCTRRTVAVVVAFVRRD